MVEMVEALLETLVMFVILAVVFSAAGVFFDAALYFLRMLATRLVARHGLVRAARVRRRVRRAGGLRHRYVAIADLVRDVGLPVGLSSFGVVVAAQFLGQFIVVFASRRTVEHWLVAIGLTLILVYLAHLLGPTGLLRAVRYIGGRESRKPSAWPSRIPENVDWMASGAHHAAAASLYRLYMHVHLLLVAATGTLMTIPLSSLQVGPSGSPRATLYVVLAALLVGAVQLAAVWAIWRLAPRLRALDLITKFLTPESLRGALQRQVGADPSRSRAQLVRIVQATEVYVGHLQRAQRIAVRHPTAHVLTLEANLLRAYLAKPRSLEQGIPDEVEASLRRVAAILVGGTTKFLDACEDLTGPADRAVDTPSGRSWTSRLSDVIDLTDRSMRPIGFIAVAVAVVWLLVSGAAAVEDVVQWLLP